MSFALTRKFHILPAPTNLPSGKSMAPSCPCWSSSRSFVVADAADPCGCAPRPPAPSALMSCLGSLTGKIGQAYMSWPAPRARKICCRIMARASRCHFRHGHLLVPIEARTPAGGAPMPKLEPIPPGYERNRHRGCRLRT